MKRRYNKWSEILGGPISAEDHLKIKNSVQVFVRTPKGWNSIAVCYTAQDAQDFIDRILSGKVKLKYDHEKVFKIG